MIDLLMIRVEASSYEELEALCEEVRQMEGVQEASLDFGGFLLHLIMNRMILLEDTGIIVCGRITNGMWSLLQATTGGRKQLTLQEHGSIKIKWPLSV